MCIEVHRKVHLIKVILLIVNLLTKKRCTAGCTSQQKTY